MAKTNTISDMAAALRNAKNATQQTPSADNTAAQSTDNATQTATPQPAVAPSVSPAPAAEAPKQTQVADNAQQATASTAPSEEQSSKTAAEVDGIKPVDVDNDAEFRGLNDQIKYIKQMAEARKPESDADKAKREKRERRQKTMAKIFDGINALSNLYFTTQGAPNAYKYESESHMTPLQKRIEDAKKERAKNDDERNAFLLKLGDLENQRAQLAVKVGNDRAARYYANKKDKRDDEAHQWKKSLQPYIEEEQGFKRDKAKADSDAAQSAAKYADELNKAKVETEGKKSQYYSAAANDKNASAAEHNRGNRLEYEAEDRNGRVHRFKTKQAADTFAKQHGTYVKEVDVTETETETNQGHRKKSSKSTRKTETGHAKIGGRTL